MGKDFDDARLCRINGQQPTARERWVAFWRLWRISQKNGKGTVGLDAHECFQVILGDSDKYCAFIYLAGCSNDPLQLRHCYPKSLRQKLLESAKFNRLYGGRKREWLERDKEVARTIVQTEGIEVTPEQVGEIRWKMLNGVRRRCWEAGLPCWEDDYDLFYSLVTARIE